MVHLRLLQHHTGLCHHNLPRILYPTLPTMRVSQNPLISCSFNPILSGWGTDALRRPTCGGRAKSKAEPQELCEQRREREISTNSLRSSGLNLHNQLDESCISGITEQTIIPKLRPWIWEQLQTWGLLPASNLFLVLCLSQFSIQSLLSLVDLFMDLVVLSFFLFLYIDISFFPFSFFLSVYVYASLCDFVCVALLTPFVLGVSLSIILFLFFFIFTIVFSTCYHWWICFLV